MHKKSKDLPAAQLPRKIHVAFVLTRFDMGGMERYVARVANGLDDARFRSSIICLDRSGTAADWITNPSVRIIELEKGHGNSYRIVSKLTRVLRDEHIDVLHSHNWGTMVESSLAASKLRSVSHVHAERGSVLGSDQASSRKMWLRKMAMRWVFRRLQLATTNSQTVAARLKELTGIDARRVRVIPNGVDCSLGQCELAKARAQVRRDLGIADNELVLGSVGRLVAVKNFSRAVRAFASASADEGGFQHLLLVGEGPDRATIERQIADCNVQRKVHLVGSRDNVWDYLSTMDCYVNSSNSEGMSQSIVEAMAVGLPVIATNVGDARNMLLGGQPCGMLVEAEDLPQFVDAIRRLTHTVFCADLARNAMERHRQVYASDAMLGAYESMYIELVAKSKGKCVHVQ